MNREVRVTGFVKLANPPAYEPTHCDGCGCVIKLSEDVYSGGREGTFCERCTEKRFSSQRGD